MSVTDAGLEPVTAAMQTDILARASIPEHVLPLMTAVSGGKPYWVDDHLVLLGQGWATLIGYPLDGDFSANRLVAAVDRLRTLESISMLNFIAPVVPEALQGECQSYEEDEYLVLNLEAFHLTSKLRRAVRKGEAKVTINKAHSFEQDHQRLVDELANRIELPPMVAGLYAAMPRYLHQSNSGWILEARDSSGRLAAFFVVDGAAPNFDIYLLGAHSRVHEVPYASDVLFKVMVDQALERSKESLQLGLGVNPGIRRFKEKWGGKAYFPYHACQILLRPPGPISFLDSLLETIS
jgi:hypothetical protein